VELHSDVCVCVYVCRRVNGIRMREGAG